MLISRVLVAILPVLVLIIWSWLDILLEFFMEHLVPSWILSLTENLASSSLQHSLSSQALKVGENKAHLVLYFALGAEI